jgi:hypothetical protein
MSSTAISLLGGRIHQLQTTVVVPVIRKMLAGISGPAVAIRDSVRLQNPCLARLATSTNFETGPIACTTATLRARSPSNSPKTIRAHIVNSTLMVHDKSFWSQRSRVYTSNCLQHFSVSSLNAMSSGRSRWPIYWTAGRGTAKQTHQCATKLRSLRWTRKARIISSLI